MTRKTPQLSKHQEGILQYATMQTMLGREVSFEQKLDEYIETQIDQARREGAEEMKGRCINTILNCLFLDMVERNATIERINSISSL